MARASRSALALAALLALASCDPPPAEEGFELRMNLMQIDPAVIDSLRITFTPDAANNQRFMSVEPMSFEGGRISYSVAPDGALVMVVSGSLVQERAVASDNGTWMYALQLFSDDTRMRSPTPQVSAVAFRGAEAVADGRKFLPAWPLPLGGFDVLAVPCLPAASASGRCRP